MGVESEGEFDSKALLKGLVEKSHELGTVYINAEVTGFELEKQRDVLMEGVAPGTYQRINKVLYKTPDNEEYAIKFAACILAAGGQSGQIAKLAKVGIDDGLLSVPLPIENRLVFLQQLLGFEHSYKMFKILLLLTMSNCLVPYLMKRELAQYCLDADFI